MPDPSDEQLVRAFQNGDEAAFTAFATRHTDRLFRLAMMWLKDVNVVDDAVQETLLRTYTGIGRFRFGAKPTTWMLRILKNVCREQNRRRTFVPMSEGVLAGMVDGADLAEAAGADDCIAELRAAVGALPERQRQVVTLRIFEELSISDTARIMRCREGTVKAHLNKAVNALKDRVNIEQVG